MASYNEITDGEIDPESPITTSLMTKLRDNPEAIAEGASGAPRIVYGALNLSSDIRQSDIANDAVGQGELKTNTGSVSASLSSGSSAERTLPGGLYGFSLEYRITGGSTSEGRVDYQGSDVDSYSQRITLTNESGGERTVSARQTYIQSSPPYDLGDGECGLFVELDVLADKTIGGTYVASDPIWANNGPTDIRTAWTDKNTGNKYKRVRKPVLCRDDLEAGRCDIADYIAAQKEAPIEDVEITPEYKNADMGVIPHSWASAPQGVICLLDPVNTHDLLALHNAGEDIADLIHKGYIKIGDEVSRYGPPGVKVVSWKFR